VHIQKQNDHLVADIFSSERTCIVTYKIYYQHFGVIRVYAKRLGIDIRGECEIDVPAGKSTEIFNIQDDSFRNHASEKKLCVDITYHIYKTSDEVSLRHKNICE
jgi:hypothetical protein